MYESVYDFKTFYNTRIGRIVRRVLQERIREIWPDVHGLSLMGIGYATPYLRIFREEAERVFAIMPAGQGAHDWPHEGPNCVALAEQAELPIETNSVDRILMVHNLEFTEFPKPALQEIWRVLKSNGRLLVVTPNRAGLWARTEHSPFGHGTPYSLTQLTHALRDNLFVHETTEEALFVPPLKYSTLLKSAGFFERYGRSILPVVAGVHIVEASKQIYASVDRGSGSTVRIRGRGVFMPKPVPNNFNKDKA
ncbi:MAG: methyltransferase domain-containing protein [Rhodospirillales bacterium]|nr:methyltransferase domain-containing protein [Alphaproteobacteria bacterium]MCB9981672.1 methyltransferase domain-containing protein [Rhodospirillales bacterium]